MRILLRALTMAALVVSTGCAGSHIASVPSGERALTPQLNSTGPGPSTLYVSGEGAVYAYDLGASGDAAPISKTGGYYYQSGGSNGAKAAIAGIATNAHGDLVVVQNFRTPQGDGNSCEIIFIPARTSQSAANSASGPCNANSNLHSTGIFAPTSTTTGAAIGVTFTGPGTGATPAPTAFGDDIDVLMHFIPSGNTNAPSCNDDTADHYEVDRYRVSSGTITPTDCIPLDQGDTAVYHAVAGSVNGAIFTDYSLQGSDTIERYDGVNNPPTHTGSIPGAGPLAVSANPITNTGYRVVASKVGGSTTIYSFKVGSGGTMSFTHALGTFSNSVGALAVDNSGNIYVGVNQPNGVTKVKVYGPAKTEATDPDYILNNPVRRPNPAASPAAKITGIAIQHQST